MLGPALAAIAAVWISDQKALIAWFLFLAAIVVGALGKKYTTIIVISVAVLTGGLHLQRLTIQRAVEEYYGSWVEMSAVVDLEPSGKSAVVRCLDGGLSGAKLRVWFGMETHDLEVGDIISMKGRVAEPHIQKNPQTFPEKQWLYRQGVSAGFIPQYWVKTGDSVWSLTRVAVQVRHWVKQRLLQGLDSNHDEAKIIVAMALGERPRDASELIDSYRLSGAIHVFAVSGLHVMMVGGIAACLLKTLSLPRPIWVGLVIATMLFYALVTGLRPPALRAAVMGAILLGAWVVGRKVVLVNSLCVGVIVALLFDGHMLFLPGFQLSFGVLLAIAVLGGILTKAFAWVSVVDPFLPRSLYTKAQEWWLVWRRKIQAGLVVATSAWIGSSPLTFIHFGVVTPMSIVVALPVVGLLYCSLCLGVASLVLGSISPSVGEAVNRMNAKVASLSHQLVKSTAELPVSHYAVAPWTKEERVIIYALEDGASAVYLGIGGGVMLDVADGRQCEREVLPSLIRNGAKVDTMVLSHLDHKHVGGVEILVGRFPIKQVLMGEEGSLNENFAASSSVLKAKDEGLYQVSETCVLEYIQWSDQVGGLADDRCPVFLVHWKGLRIIFLNDVGYRFERWIESSERDFRADIVVWSGHSKDEMWGSVLVENLKTSLVIGPKKLPLNMDIVQIDLEQSGAVEIRNDEGRVSALGFINGNWVLDKD